MCGGVGEFGRVDLTVEDEGWGGDERGLFRLCRVLPIGTWTPSFHSGTRSQLTIICPQSIICSIYVAVTSHRFAVHFQSFIVTPGAGSLGELKVKRGRDERSLIVE